MPRDTMGKCLLCGMQLEPDTVAHTCIAQPGFVTGAEPSQLPEIRFDVRGIDTGEIHRAPLLKEIDKLRAQLAEANKELDTQWELHIAANRENHKLTTQLATQAQELERVRDRTVNACLKIVAALCRATPGQVYSSSILEACEEVFEFIKTQPASDEENDNG